MLGALATISDMVLGQATGRTAPEPDPVAADPGAAQRKLEAAKLSLVSISDLYGGKGERLSRLVAAQSTKTGNDADDSFRTALDAASASLETVKGPIARMSPDEASSGPLTKAFDEVDKARRILRTEVASQLGVAVVFSDSDGDG